MTEYASYLVHTEEVTHEREVVAPHAAEESRRHGGHRVEAPSVGHVGAVLAAVGAQLVAVVPLVSTLVD